MIPEIQKSPSKLLNAHKYRTNLPMIDLTQPRNDERNREVDPKM